MYTPGKRGLYAYRDVSIKETHIDNIYTKSSEKLQFWLILYSLTSDDVPVQRKRGYAFSYGGGLKFNDPEVEGW